MKNPFPLRKPPEFVPYKNDLQRGVAVWPGHEHIIIKREDLEPGDGLRAGDFGISSDSWVLVIRDADHVASMEVTSWALNRRLLRTPEQTRAEVARIWRDLLKPGPQLLHGNLNFCTSYPTEVESIQNGATSKCFLQTNGHHFSGCSTILGGDPIVLPLDKIFMEGPPVWWTAEENVVRENLFALHHTWLLLEEWFLVQRHESKKSAETLPRQCEHCKGAGTVPK